MSYQSFLAQQGREEVNVLDAKNCTYNIAGQEVTLKNGYSEQEAAPGSASKIITQYFGNEAAGDFNGDGFGDLAFLFTQDSGGSGTFYYVAAALGGQDACAGTNALLLGDRIAPQATEFRDGLIIVNYAARQAGEPMTATPSAAKSSYFKVDSNQLIEVQSSTIMEDAIKTLFADKYGKNVLDVTINFGEQADNYARGAVSFAPGGSENSGMFLAAKVSGKWRLIYEGQGAYTCILAQGYNFPADMIADCSKEKIAYIDITPEAAKMLIDTKPSSQLAIIDVSPDYDNGHLPKAINYYAGDGSLDNAIPNLDPTKEYLVYCHTDAASIAGAQKLVDAGFASVYRLKDNYDGWVEAGYPVE